MQQTKNISIDSDLVHRTLVNIVTRNKGETFSGVVADQLEKWNDKVEKAPGMAEPQRAKAQ